MESLQKAADAATTLLDDGKNQLKLLGGKLEAAQNKFNMLNQNIEAMVVMYKTEQTRLASLPLSVPLGKGFQSNPMILVTRKKMEKIRTDAESLWAKESKPGGAIFNYVRRCSHTGNYLQAPHIMALAMREKFSPNSVVATPQTDYFAGSSLATNSRDAFTKLELEYAKCKVAPP